MRRLLMVLIAGLMVVPMAHAKQAKKPVDDGRKKGISAILKTLDWAAHYQGVLDQLKVEIDDEFKDRLENLAGDTFRIDRARREKGEKFKKIAKTYIRFTAGNRTGYETSLIGKDFLTGQDESVLRIDDKHAQRYFFFKHDRLWKIVVAYNSVVTQSMTYAEFTAQVQDKYGKPAEQRKGDDGKVHEVIWRDNLTELVAEDRSAFYGTYVMKFLSLAEGVELEGQRNKKAGGPSTMADARADSMLGDIIGGNDVPAANTDVVDQITGTDHQIDMSVTRKDFHNLVRSDDMKTPKKRRKTRKAKKKKKTDTLSAPSGGDAIIY